MSFPLWNTKEVFVQAALFHTVEVKGDHGCQARFSVNNGLNFTKISNPISRQDG